MRSVFVSGASAPDFSRASRPPQAVARTRACRPTRRRMDRRPLSARVTEEEEAQYERGAQSFSRRDFAIGSLGGMALAAALWYGPRDDLRSRAKLSLLQRYPALFGWLKDAPDQWPSRESLDVEFVHRYMQALENVADSMGIISTDALHSEEDKVRSRAASFFFRDPLADAVAANPADRPSSDDIGFDEQWFNFILYARLHVIAQLTSPQKRLAFIQNLAAPVLDSLNLDHSMRTPLTEDELIHHPELWLTRVSAALAALQARGLMSSFQVMEFDGAEGSLWRDQSRGSLAVYINGPATMQAAQLIGEEQYEEISPKLSTVLRLVLQEAGIRGVSFEDYYLDTEYRPDPAQYTPSQFAVEFDINLGE